jgi:purine-cytosine permease-like protein
MAASEPGAGVFRRLDRLNEFEREPVAEDKLHGGTYFAGSFAGEHVAATEFVIGALFVAGGAQVYDVIVGLLLGNLLAVLSWTLICAPIAVDTRLTLYWYLRKIAGPAVMVIYNVLNALLYCVLAGCMITVAASAVRIPFGIEPQTGWLPTDPWFVAVTIAVGTVVVLLAILGFKRLAQFASVCSPWMFIMFIAGAVVLLPLIGHFSGPAGLWYLGKTKIWTGPPPYQSTSVVTPEPGSQIEWPHIVLRFPDDAELLIEESPPTENEEAAPGENAGASDENETADAMPPERTYHTEGAVNGFAISGNGKGERTFVEADARLEGHTVIVSSRSVSDPAVVSYNEGLLDGNLRIKREGYSPVPSFRSYVENADDVLTFWQIVAFAWICNLAMHLGLSDMALFRYARRSWYGLFSAFGMYLGHYVAWICAGVMGAAVASATMMNTPLTMLDSGEVAFRALGVMGALAVVIAGWTTSNPTLYRAGLALQVVTPGWPRWLVTLVAGAVTTAIACFPFVFRELLNFVGLYGLLLMPVGAIVVVEHWIFPRIGFTRFWSSRKGQVLNRPALAAWAISLAAALLCWQAETVGGWLAENVHESLSAVAAIHLHLFFLAGPVWILSVVLYLVFSAMAGAAGHVPELPEEEGGGERKEPQKEVEESAAPIPDAAPHAARESRVYRYFAGLALACLASILLFSYCICMGYMAHDAVLLRIGGLNVDFGGYLVIATGVYFVSSALWMAGREKRKRLTAA